MIILAFTCMLYVAITIFLFELSLDNALEIIIILEQRTVESQGVVDLNSLEDEAVPGITGHWHPVKKEIRDTCAILGLQHCSISPSPPRKHLYFSAGLLPTDSQSQR